MVFHRGSKRPFETMLHIQGWVVPEVHIKCGNRFFVEIRPPQNPIIFCIFSKFLSILASKRFMREKSAISANPPNLWRQKFGRNFENIQKITGFCGGRNWAKNPFIHILWSLGMTHPWFWDLFWKSNFELKKRNTQISLSTELPVELSRGNRLEIYKDEIFRHPTH